MRLFKTATLVFISVLAFAQETTFEEMKSLFPEDMAAYSYDKQKVVIDYKKGKLNIYTDNSTEMWFLKENSNMYSDRSLYYSKFSSIDYVSAHTLVPKKKAGKYSKFKVTNFEDQNVISSGIFYDDGKKKVFSFPSVQKGSRGVLEYRESIKDPKFLGKFYFNSYVPTKESEFSVSFPSNVKVEYTLFNQDVANIEFTETTKGSKTTYTWSAKNLDAYEVEGNGPTISYYAPHVIVRISEVEHKDGSVEKILSNVDDLYAWYYSLVKDVNTDVNEEMKAIVDSITAGIESKDEIARTVFNWVQSNIKYVAFEDGMGGFIPREAKFICQKRYGDCKDMASIITEMLEYAGVEANLTWIGSRSIPYKYNEVPTPSVDNHMIASYRNEKNEVVFLDATGSYTPYGYPTGFIQGKESLIGKGETYEIVEVPIVAKERNEKIDSVYLTLKDDVLYGSGTISTKGYDKLNYVYALINKNDKKRHERFGKMLGKGNNKLKLDSVSFKGLEDRDTGLDIIYSYELADYAKSSGDETYINLNLEKTFKGEDLDIEKRKGIPLKTEYRMSETEIVVVEVPKGYEINYVPENSSYSNELFGYTIEYTKTGNTITMKKQFYTEYILLEKEHFSEWNKMVKSLGRAYSEVVILKKK